MEAVDGFTNMSKADILRGIVAEKLTTAAQEILAVVERTIAGYEEEASCLRQEIDRQRRQLEDLLQPRIKLETIDEHFPVCEPVAGGGPGLPEEEELHKYEPNDQFPVFGGGPGLPEEEEQHKYELRVEDESLGLICYPEAQMEEDEDEEDEEHHTEPDRQVALRSLRPTVQSDRRSLGRPRISASQDHINLRVRILEDSQINVLSVDVFRKYPVQEVRCPRGLQEADFMDLLRSTFPQLADGKHFDVFTADRVKTLQPLGVETLTPEEIYRCFRSNGHSALYVRLKTQEEVRSADEEKNAAAADSPPSGQTRFLSPRVQSERRKVSRRRNSQLQDHLDLRIRILENSQINKLSPYVFQKHPVLELQCPRGLQEADFLDLLRSTFPQLAAQKPFDFFTIDRTKRLQPLRVEALTPEEIYRTAGHSGLYIQLKPPKEDQTREIEAAPGPPSTDQCRPNTRVQSDRCSSGAAEPQKHVDLRICILEDSHINVLSANVFRKYPVQEVRCPGGLREADFMDLLRSTFPQLADGTHFDVFTTDKTKKLQPLRVERLTPEEIDQSIRSSGHSALYIRLKEQEEVQSSDEDHHEYSSSSSEITRLNSSSPVLSSSPTSQLKDMEADDDGGESQPASLLSLLVLSEDEVSTDSWRREKHLRESRPETTAKKRRVKHPGIQSRSSPKASSDSSDAPLSCKVCQVLRGSTNMLIKHAWSHVDDPGRLCGVCGEQSESGEELRGHLQTHQKTHRCNICGKSFLSLNGLSGHVARHNGQKPHKCKICHKAFAQKWVLKNHMWIHATDKPHKCDFCPKSFASKVDLRRHRVSHTRQSQHRCSMCGKSLSSLEVLSKHMLKHSGQTVRDLFACNTCSKSFSTKQTLKVHTRVHAGTKRFKCPVCDKTFSQSHCVKRHVKSHHGGSDYRQIAAPVQTLSVNGIKKRVH